jgi:O-antigen/teichoic acid export membrane protein
MIGMLTLFSAVASALQESGFTAALTNKKEVHHDDYNAVFWFSTLMGASLYLILFFCAPLIARFYDNPAVTPIARYLFLSFLFSSTGTAQSAYLFRNLMVKQRAMSQLPALFLSGCVGVLMAWRGMAYWGLATQTLVYITVTQLFYWRYSPWRPTFSFNFRPIREMFGFSSKLLVTNLFLQLNNNLINTLLGRLFSSLEVGYYAQANKWNNMGDSLINGAVGSVAQPVLARASGDDAHQLAVFRKMLRFTSFLSFPLMLGLMLVAREFIVLAIGDKWMPSVELLQIICLWGAFFPISTLYVHLVISKGKSNVYMWSTIIQCLVQLGVILITYRYGIRLMVAVYVGINIAWLAVWHYFVWREIRLTLWQAMRDVFPFLGIALFTMGLTWLTTRGIANLYLLLAARLVMAAALYALLMRLSNAAIFRESIAYFLHKTKTL